MTLAIALTVVAGGSIRAIASSSRTTGRSFYVDCRNADAMGSGVSAQSPWNSLDPLNATEFMPGDTIYIKRGTVCHGTLAPKGSGTEGAPIRLTAYGEGPRPKVVAVESDEESLRLFDQQYWDIDSLDLQGGRVYGIFISGNKGILHHIHLSNLAVHDVLGNEKMKSKDTGLVVLSSGSIHQHFDDVLVDGVNAWNTRQWMGIEVGGGNLGFPPESAWNTNVTIRNSTVHDVQGDGIVLFRVRKGRIENSVAWNTGMQITESIGTPNAIWTWMCDDCTVIDNEAYLTDSPGVDGGAFDIDYGNTKNSVLDNYGHDTQGYCVAVFGAGFVTRQSTVRGNLCINNGRSPRMANYQGAIFLLSWNGGSIDGLTMENNVVYWNPYESAPALLNEANIKAGTAVFRDNTIYSTSPRMVDSNAALSFAQNHYRYFGAGRPEWKYGDQRFGSLAAMQRPHQEISSSLVRELLQQWPLQNQPRPQPRSGWRLSCDLPIPFNTSGMIGDAAMRQIVVLKSLSRQYRARGLQVTLRMTSRDTRLFETERFRNGMIDLDLDGIAATQAAGDAAERMVLRSPDGGIAGQWDGFAGPVKLGLALRQQLGEPAYSQMGMNDGSNRR
ncbi:MAG: right-handed parallel beta-helix repeat-containing protein [Acidobacteriaceae bacterium]